MITKVKFPVSQTSQFQAEAGGEETFLYDMLPPSTNFVPMAEGSQKLSQLLNTLLSLGSLPGFNIHLKPSGEKMILSRTSEIAVRSLELKEMGAYFLQGN